MSEGWIKLHRQIEENGLWFKEPFSYGQAWIDMILFANHKPGSFWVRGVEVKLKRGQLGWSELTMARRWKWSRNKVRRFLLKLDKNGYVKQQKVHRITSITTICNYDKYQGETTNDTTERQQKDNRRYTNKNDKNVKNVKKTTSGENKLKNRILKWHLRDVFKTKISSDELEKRITRTIEHYGESEVRSVFNSVANSYDPHPSDFWKEIKELKK